MDDVRKEHFLWYLHQLSIKDSGVLSYRILSPVLVDGIPYRTIPTILLSTSEMLQSGLDRTYCTNLLVFHLRIVGTLPISELPMCWYLDSARNDSHSIYSGFCLHHLLFAHTPVSVASSAILFLSQTCWFLLQMQISDLKLSVNGLTTLVSASLETTTHASLGAISFFELFVSSQWCLWLICFGCTLTTYIRYFCCFALAKGVIVRFTYLLYLLVDT